MLSVFAALLKCRTPAFEKWLNDVGDAAAKRIMRDAVPNPEAIQRRLEMWGQNDPGDTDQAQRLYERIKREEWRFKASANMRVDQMLRLTRQFGRELTLMPWTIARAPSDTSYITTDNPMVVHTVNRMPNPPADWPTDSNPYSLFGEGILATEAEILLPLSQHSCLIIGMEQYNGRYIEFKKADTCRVNNIIATHYDRFLIARDEALRRRVARTVPG